ncbi:MAG: right-handed parallel beta-helix repeat-containing protein [Gemmatimonadota bacterium]
MDQPRPLRRLLLVGAATAVLGCAGVHPGGTLVTMYDNQFNSAVLRVPVGARVTFLNMGRSTHNATATDGSWKTADLVAHSGEDGRGADMSFDKPGVYRYRCSYHGTPDGKGMSGVLVVGDVAYSPSAKGVVEPAAAPTGVTRAVPSAYPTIQAAVDAAAPGDLVLVDRGVYKEEVTVTTPSLVIRGVDRNEVIIDGEFVRGNGVAVLADEVAVENMTARNAVLNGFFWSGVVGYRGSFLTAYNNGDYGIYSFGSSDGLFEDSYASGSPDSGFYIGQCYPCKTVVRNVIAERNALGFSGTNAGGDLYVVSSIWRHNRGGIVPSSLDVELNPPQRDAVFAANLVYSNNNRDAPATTLTTLVLGNGILLAGTVNDLVTGNVVIDHGSHGIIASPIQDRFYYPPRDNIIRGNRVMRSGRADLANSGPGATGNCFMGNEHQSSVPLGLQVVRGCDHLTLPWWSDFVSYATILYRATAAQGQTFPDWKTQPVPPAQPNMPDPQSARARLARKVFESLHFEVAKAALPAGTDSVIASFQAGSGAVREAGFLGHLGANLSFLAGPLILLWWLMRGMRRSRPTEHRWRRRIFACVGGVVIYAGVLVVSAMYYGRL